jgi:hypothetical protein
MMTQRLVGRWLMTKVDYMCESHIAYRKTLNQVREGQSELGRANWIIVDSMVARGIIIPN